MNSSSSAVPPPTSSPALTAASLLMGCEVRFTLTDERVLVGKLHCIDWKENVILRNAELWKNESAVKVGGSRRLLPFVAMRLADVARAETI